jgi:hypothetical protein
LSAVISWFLLCSRSISGNTTNFWKHIETEHEDEQLKDVTSASESKKPLPQQNIMQSYVNGKMSMKRQSEIDDSLVKFISGKVIPVSVVDNVLFREFIAKLDGRYKVPSRSTVMNKMHKKKNEIDELIKHDIESAHYISITHDGWTSLNTESYFTTTIHFIDETWVLKNAVLGTVQVKGSHTSEHIAEELRATQAKWQLPVPIATTDNAANEKKAYEILNWERFGCYGHRINLIVKNALGITEVNRLLGKARKLVTFFHQSSSITDLLTHGQTEDHFWWW